MIDESTWHRDPAQQTCFVWCATPEGVQIHHSTEGQSYVIYWNSFHAVFTYARELAQQNGNVVTAGMHVTAPTAGSVGEWVLNQNLRTSVGQLTPRHLSFLGPIFARMGFVTRQLSGNSIQWRFV